ncbi:MAG: C25 family cysteine peptidase [Bacteroidota bacterium]|nr:C25 family cysteine peptidase [Bacteroidota bacterium]
MSRKLIWLSLFLVISTLATSQPYLFHNEWIDYSKTYYKFKIMGFGSDNVGAPIRNGVVRIPFSTLASSGLVATFAENFQLWRDGEEVPIYVSKATGKLESTDYIEFVGEINNGKLDKELYKNPDYQLNDKWSFQTDTAAYFLTVNTASANKRMVNAGNSSANNLAAEPFFMCTVGRYFRNNISNGFAANVGKNLYSSSYDKGEGWVSRAVRPVAGCGSATLPQGFSGLYPYLPGPMATLRVNAVGDAQNSRTVKINLNNDSITTFQMDYINYIKDEELIDVNKLNSGVATVYVVNQSPAGCDEMRVAMVEITYPRVFNMGGASIFKISLDPSSVGRNLAITNFNYGGVAPVLYDQANNKRYVGNITNADTVKIALAPSDVPYDLVLSTQAGSYYKTVSTVEKRNFINYGSVGNQGNYLIISNPLIYGSGSSNYVQQYSQFRSSAEGGLYNAKVIDINELVDQFAWGVKKHPLSIKNFLRYSSSTFAEAPKYVFLIGKGVIYSDYRTNESNVLADQLNLVPTYGNPASDNLLASNDFTAVPAIPIGRLSAVSAQEVGDYLLKVKQHDSAQHSPIQTIDAKGWMKNVIQIAGANDVNTGVQIDGYLDGYKKIISDTSFGANVKGFSKSANPDGYPEAVNSFKEIYEHGASLITYFGHSSNTNLDFNLDNPETYSNAGKYPVFIANGCTAGDHFLFEPGRLTTKSTVSEKFVLSPQRGAIGYLASTGFGIVNYLNLYTLDFYKALAQTSYNQSVGSIIKEAITSTLNSTNPNDYYSRVHAEQYAYHGDPAIVINASSLPDYVIEKTQMQVSPSYVSVADTSFRVTVKVNNIGRATKDSVTIKIRRESADGETFTILTKTLAPINYADSVIVDIPIVADRDKGLNKITATVDFNNKINEATHDNNSSTIEVFISGDEIRPVFPFNYAVITSPDIKLSASTSNPLDVARNYVMELDTTAVFNSPVKIVKRKNSSGGVVEFDPGILYQNGVTYYWRVASDSSAINHWVNASFVYRSSTTAGFEQGHLYQHLQSQFTRLSLDSTSRKFKYNNKLHNLFITNSIYPYSGVENEQFSIAVDGSNYIQSACLGHSVIFNVFDSLTFLPTKNLTQPFGATAVCDSMRLYNFEYDYTTARTRKNAMDFIDAIPAGSYVAVRIILNEPFNSFAKNWAADTALYGKENSLYHRLKKNGFKTIDSFYYARTWAFVFKKSDTTFAPAYTLSNGLYDRITLSVNCTTANQQGYINSPVFGPANEWKNIYWNGYGLESGNDRPAVNVFGITKDNTDTLLYTLDSSTHSFDISAVDAAIYPNIRLQMSNADSLTATPYQLTKWGTGYVQAPEGAIAPNLYYSIPDTVGTLTNDTLKGILNVGFAFKNVSKANFDSLGVKVILYDSAYNPIVYPVHKLRPLDAGDTLHANFALDVSLLSGWYNLFVEVNPKNDYQTEQFSFNNFLYKYVYMDKTSVMPVTLINFNAAVQNSNVKTTWSASSEINAKEYEVQHSINGIDFKKVGVVASLHTSADAVTDYAFVHINVPAGKNYYRLKIIDNDGFSKFSPVRLVTLTNTVSINVYPNPVKDVLNIRVTRTDNKASDLRLINAFGQQLWQRKLNGTMRLNMSNWPYGNYILQVNEETGVTSYKINKQ